MAARRVVSGIQPTGVPHLGNYLGAIRKWVQLQDAVASPSDLLYFIADLHAITVPYTAGQLHHQCRVTAAALLACGLREDRCTLFRQSAVGALGAVGLLHPTAKGRD
jgi:tryptophanyl-tRNA synthetase